MSERPGLLVLPAGFLEDPQVVAALKIRDFATVFTAAKAAGLSYNHIAEACSMKPERVSLVARREASVTSFEGVERIADGLGIPGRYLGLAQRPWEKPAPPGSTEQPHEPSTDEAMKRRLALKALLAGGLSAVALGTLADERHTLDAALAGRTTPTDLDYWEEVADNYALGYGGQAPAARLGVLAADVVELRTLLSQPQTTEDRGRLCRTVGQLSGMAAIVLHDLGEAQEARGWFHSARLAAKESGDKQVLAWLYAREAMTPLTYGVPREAVRLSDLAVAAAGGRPSAASALASAVSARAHAVSGNAEAAREALTQAQAFAESLDSAGSADTWLGLPEQKLQIHLSHAYTRLGDVRPARSAQARALQLSGASSYQARALMQMDAALCDHHAGDTVDGCRRAVDALVELPADQRTGLVRSRAADLLRVIPASRTGERAVADLREVLRA
ncbi:hypothetical protein [Streptomyces sp. NRRL B-24484]|uniref:hypothetical protein n=1 Tax=Streptomyces sp. NRRL B-24484 TaxID=1463833 RepID=UPI0004C1BCCB|nr:hypothetical protein [Streptomyces sp. NRRL B-24484]